MKNHEHGVYIFNLEKECKLDQGEKKTISEIGNINEEGEVGN